MSDKTQPLLLSRRFLPLFITQFFGAFNDNVFKNAFVIWVTYYLTKKSDINVQLIIAIASALFILPFLLFSAFAGQIADKYDRSRIVQMVKVAELAIMTFCFTGFYLEDVYLLLFLLFLMGVHSTFFGPLKYSLLPEHLKSKELIAGNALIEGGTFLAILFGTIFGGIVILCSCGTIIISIAVVLFSVVGLAASCFIPKSKISDPHLRIDFNIFSQTFKILNYAKKEKNVWLVILGVSWFWFVGITFLSQFPFYVKNIINGDEYIVTLFLTIFSIGIGFGSFLCNKLQKGKINANFVPLGSAGITIGIIVFVISSYLYNKFVATDHLFDLKEFFIASNLSYIITLGILMIAISCGIFIVPLYAIMQHYSEEKYLSRIIAANNVMNALFMVVASISVIFLLSFDFTILEIFMMTGLINLWFVKILKLKI